MAVRIQGGSNTAGQANVSSNYELMVKPTTDPDAAGVVSTAGNSGDPADVGGSLIRALEVNSDWRLRVNQDRPIYWCTFNTNVQSSYFSAVSTWSQAHGSQLAGGFTMNSGASTAAGSVTLQTIRNFNLPTEG